MTEINIQTERIDDIPLLVHQQREMGIPEVLDQVIHPHGNRQLVVEFVSGERGDFSSCVVGNGVK